MNYEIELLNARFDASRNQIQRAINYFCTLRLSDIPEDTLRMSPAFISDMRTIVKMETIYEGIFVEIQFANEGDKQIWFGITNTDSPWGRYEHLIGHIRIDQAMLHHDKPVEVRLVCGWRPFAEFFREMADFLRRSFGKAGEIYRLGIEQERELLATIYSNSALIYQNQGAIMEQLKSLRLWAKSVQKEGLPMDSTSREAITELARGKKNEVSLIQQLELLIPLIPGILSYKVALNSENSETLSRILDDIKQLIG